MTFLSWLIEAALSFFAKRILGSVFPEKTAIQQAVDTETAMAQAVANTPDKAIAIQDLENGNA